MKGKNKQKKLTKKQKAADALIPRNDNNKFTKKSVNIEPRSAKQADTLRALSDPSVHGVVCEGWFGTGKTYVPTAFATRELLSKRVSKVIVARANVKTGKDEGALPGDIHDKLYGLLRNVLDTMEKLMGPSVFAYHYKKSNTGNIEIQPFSSVRGRSFDEDTIVIIDEAQQLKPSELLCIVTRCSDRCKFVLCGDLSQRDVCKNTLSGLDWFRDFTERHGIAVDFINYDNPETDVVRGDHVKQIAIGLKKDMEEGIYVP